MTFEELWAMVPTVQAELTEELVRLGGEHLKPGAIPQYTACSVLSIRAISLLRGMTDLLKPDTFDSWDVLMRAFMETRDLLTTFRFDNEQTRKHIGKWFKGDQDSWKPAFKVCERFLREVGAETELGRKWSLFSGLAHPMYAASNNSIAIVAARTFGHIHPELALALRDKRVDFVGCISTLFIVASYDLPGWIPTQFEVSRTPTMERFRAAASRIVVPIMREKEERDRLS
jgi:hypothetical protein